MANRGTKVHEVIGPRKDMARLVDPAVVRGCVYRARARELIEAAWRTTDMSRKQYLFDLSKTFQRTADAMAPLPPAEPPVFSK